MFERWFAPSEVVTFLRAACIATNSDARLTVEAWPIDRYRAVREFAVAAHLIRRIGQTVELTRHGRRYLRHYAH